MKITCAQREGEEKQTDNLQTVIPLEQGEINHWVNFIQCAPWKSQSYITIGSIAVVERDGKHTNNKARSVGLGCFVLAFWKETFQTAQRPNQEMT